jgi:hypothetical protein
MPADFLPIFFAAWFVNVAYVGTLLLLMSKVERLENPGSPAKPFWNISDFALKALRFLFSGRHNDFDDRQLSRLVMICRTLLAIGLPLTVYVFWRI